MNTCLTSRLWKVSIQYAFKELAISSRTDASTGSAILMQFICKLVSIHLHIHSGSHRFAFISEAWNCVLAWMFTKSSLDIVHEKVWFPLNDNMLHYSVIWLFRVIDMPNSGPIEAMNLFNVICNAMVTPFYNMYCFVDWNIILTICLFKNNLKRFTLGLVTTIIPSVLLLEMIFMPELSRTTWKGSLQGWCLP